MTGTDKEEGVALKMGKDIRIVITGAAGLLGQNTVLLLRKRGYQNLVAIDKHRENLAVLKRLNPGIHAIEADLAEAGNWQGAFRDADVLLQMHAQITSPGLKEFQRNTVKATENVLAAVKKYRVPYIVHISSSVVISKADDDYTNTKKQQEKLVEDSGVRHCSLRPSLMFGWFDKKHLGWLSRFLKKTPVFPIPGDGKYLRQPIYAKDMAKVVIRAAEMQPEGKFNIIGREDMDYIDIIKKIRKIVGGGMIVCIPYSLFRFLLDLYAVFCPHPPFTSQQLAALTAGDYFHGDPWWEIFKVTPTPFDRAIKETFASRAYSGIVLKP